jgi:hypothetical protein
LKNEDNTYSVLFGPQIDLDICEFVGALQRGDGLINFGDGKIFAVVLRNEGRQLVNVEIGLSRQFH